MSQKIGLAPMYSTTFAVDTQVNAGTITSSPGFSPSAATARCNAVVHELAAAAWAAPVYAENICSNFATAGPCTTQPLFNVWSTARVSSSPKKGFVIGIDIGLYRLSECAGILLSPFNDGAQAVLELYGRAEA